MIKKYFFLLFSVVVFSLFVSCKEPDDPVEEPVIPVLISSDPAANTTIPVATESIKLTFKDRIVLIEKIKITVNGEVVPNVSASENVLSIQLSRLYEKTTYTLVVEKGAIKAQSGNLNPEAFTIVFTTDALPEANITPDLVIPNPSPEAIKLYDFLKTNFGKKIISGTVANVSWNINEAEWVHQHTGKYPALNCFDYIFLFASSPNSWIDYGNTKVVEDWYNAGGIVGCMWHWNVPKSENAVAGDVTYRPEETAFYPAKALVEGTWENKVMKADLEKIAGYLLLLKNKNIPVIWRPLHEAAGNIYATGYIGTAWFWWGRDGAEAFKGLWIYMFNYFKERGLNNLIWVWTTEVNDSPFYPGDEYVDIIGRDIYNTLNANDLSTEFKTLSERYPNKLITLAECGNVAGIGDQLNTGANWSWFMTWYDYDRTLTPGSAAFQLETHQHGNATFWKNTFATGKVLSREDLTP